MEVIPYEFINYRITTHRREPMRSSSAWNFRQPCAWRNGEPVDWQIFSLLPEEGMVEAILIIGALAQKLEARRDGAHSHDGPDNGD